jgi:hypothetical protein
MLTQASKFTGVGLFAVLSGLIAVSACDSGGDGGRGSDGGTTSNAGTNTAGSNNAGTNNAGSSNGGMNNAGSSTGGSGGGQMVTACPGVVPPSAMIADFEMAPAAGAMYMWGSTEMGTTDFWGGAFNYPAAVTVTVADGTMTAAGNVAEFAGFGLYVQNCADASSFQGVRFTISGNPPMSKMSFAVQTNTNEWATGVKGACLAPMAMQYTACVHPSFAIDVTDTPTTVEVLWTDLGAGKPAANATTDGSDVIGLQWILPWAAAMTAYDVSVTIDDVEFIGEGGGSGGAGSGGAGNDPGTAGAAGGQ